MRTHLLFASLAAIAAGQSVSSARADDTPVSFDTGIWRRPNLLGDMGGLRNVLGTAGITVQLGEVSEVLGNVSGGLKQGATYDGLTTLVLQMDTQKAFGWEGGTVNVSGLQIHGRNLSQYYLDNLQTASGIEASPTTRLWEVWYQQSFLAGAFDVKIGQQSLDQEFITSTGSALFINNAMGWPMLPTVDMYAGGPAYPLSSLGVRFRGQPMDNVTVLGGVFQDNPPGGPFYNDSQLRGSSRWGANANLRTGALFIAEAQYAVNQPVVGQSDGGTHPIGLPAVYKLGLYYDTAAFPDQHRDTAGRSLASPNTTGVAAQRHGNGMVYAVADQALWRPDPEGAQVLGVFARVMGAPGDRNLIDFSMNAGVTLKAPLPGRDNDTLGVGFGVAQLSGGAIAFNRDQNAYGTNAYGTASVPVRSAETMVEVTYQGQVTPWLQVQPDFQYVLRPGGGIVNPYNPTRRLGDEAIFGVRTTVLF